MVKKNRNILIINLKTYKESTGKNALNLALQAKKAALKTNKKIFLAAQPTDLASLKKVGVALLAQHIDLEEYGGHTGSITLHAVKQAGAVGTLINHSEKRIPESQIKKTVELCKKNNFLTIICAKDAEEIKRFSKYKPDFLAVEPPELIGGTISVSQAKPLLIKKSVSQTKLPVLCGAGVHNSEDVKIAIKLGAEGILVASGVVKAKNVYKEIIELLEYL